MEASRSAAAPAARAARVHRVISVHSLSGGAFLLRMTREGLDFRPGQWINVGLPGRSAQREYSVHSAPGDDFLEVLVKEVPDGAVSRRLRRCAPGDPVEIDGPHGSFCLVEGLRDRPRFLFLATGTGISPFHCFVRSDPGLDYVLLHGVRFTDELYDRGAFEPARLVPCVTRAGGAPGVYPGRLTSYLRENPVDPERYCYLCGNSDMIYEAYSTLRDQGVVRARIFAEVYF
jgi:ferredoxin/flavodoxin---NADP+ reductase